jgi:hypothetical protein
MKWGCVHRVSDLPEDVLVRILGHLDVQVLMTARLVCSKWRAASIAVLVRLSLCPPGVARGGWLCRWRTQPKLSNPCATLASRLGLLTRVSDLELEINRQEDLSLLHVPGCRTLLKSLDLLWAGYNAADLSGVTRLTRLQLLVEPQHELVSQCRLLRVLDLNGRLSDIQWLALLPLLGGLSQLRELGQVPLDARAVVDGLAPLTQLVAVWCSREGSSRCRCLSGLAAISGLQAVSLRASHDHDAGGTVEQFLLSSPQLQELILVDKCEPQLAVALGSLSRLKKLELPCYDWPLERYGRGKAYAFWCQVRDRLDLDKIAPLPSPLLLPATLEFLDVEVNEDQYRGLLRCITLLRQLTYFSVFISGFAVHAVMLRPYSNKSWRRANCLKSLTHLKHLNLGLILHPANIASDVQLGFRV